MSDVALATLLVDDVTPSAFIFDGPLSGTLTDADADATLDHVGEVGSDTYGYDYTLASISDMTGDGYADLLVGFPGGNLGLGEAFLVAGPVVGAVHLPEAYARFTVSAGESLAPVGAGGVTSTRMGTRIW